MLFRVWKDDLGVECSPAPGRIQLQLMGLASTLGFIGYEVSVITEFEAKTWLEAMTIYYNYMGFGEYNPPLLENGEIDPIVLKPL